MADQENQGGSGVSAGPQAALFENLDVDERAFEDSNPFPAVVRRGGSRKGVPNRRTEDFKKFYAASGFRDPLMFLGHVISIDTDELAKHLACKRVQALDVQRKAAENLAPYLHSKQPTQVAVDAGDATPMLVIGGDVAIVQRQVAAGAMSIDGDLPFVENQRVSEGAGEWSHGAGSHEGEKAHANQGADGTKPTD